MIILLSLVVLLLKVINLDELSGIRRNPVSEQLGGEFNSPRPVSGSWNKSVVESVSTN